MYKLVVFDIDGTLTDNPNPWLTIHHYLTTWTSLTEKYNEAFLQNNITYEEFCNLEVSHWRGAKSSDIKKLFSNVRTPLNLFKSLKRLKYMGLKLIAISSGLQFVPETLRLNDFFDEIFYNKIDIKNGVLTGKVKIFVNDKVKILDAYLKKCGLKYKEVIVIGDGNNDIGIAKKAGYSIAFCANSQELLDHTDYKIEEFNYSHIVDVVSRLKVEMTV